jgi:hypothetical protein
MNLTTHRLVLIAAASLVLLLVSSPPAAATARAAPRRPDASDTYTITSTLRLVRLFDVADMPDDFQDARLLDARWSLGNGSFQAYGAEVVAADRDKIAVGIGYTIKPINLSETYRWALAPELMPLTLKE